MPCVRGSASDRSEEDAMSTPGRRPTPTALKVLRGNPSKRPVNEREPRPPATTPRCPPHLSKEARREWRRTAKLLAEMGLLTSVDRAALALYCEAWARWVEAEQALQKYGVVMKSPNGFPVPSPYLGIATRAMEQVRHLLAEFGMSPASRSRVSAPSPADGDEDESEQFFRELRRHG
jgi:P27 family predicted phage terminase small subunit